MATTAETELLRSIAAISGKEYGLARRLLGIGITSPEALDRLVERVVRDRFQLAKQKLFLGGRPVLELMEQAERLGGEQEDAHRRQQSLSQFEAEHNHELRVFISLGYYAMYHAARALVLMVNREDESRHREVGQCAAKILEGEVGGPRLTRLTWDKAFERARDLRNEVDYSPYPDVGEPGWEFLGLPLASAAAETMVLVVDTVAACEECLRKRGVEV